MNRSRPDVTTKEDLAELIRGLANSVRTQPELWPNDSLADFLEAMAAWTEDMDGYYANFAQLTPRPSWQTFADMLMAARSYE